MFTHKKNLKDSLNKRLQLVASGFKGLKCLNSFQRWSFVFLWCNKMYSSGDMRCCTHYQIWNVALWWCELLYSSDDMRWCIHLMVWHVLLIWLYEMLRSSDVMTCFTYLMMWDVEPSLEQGVAVLHIACSTLYKSV